MRLTLSTVLLLLAAASAWSDSTYTLEVIHLNDTHSNLLASGLALHPEGFGEGFRVQAGSVARNAFEIAGARLESDNVIFLHAGDLVQGTLFYTVYRGAADAAVYNLLQPDVMALGNHEFDRGSQGLSDLLDQLLFPVVCANLDLSGDSLLAGRLPPCAVLERGGRRIGVIGLLTEELHSISSPSPETVLLPLAETAQRKVDSLGAAGIDIIVLLTHIGYGNDLRLASELTGVDLIVGGHSHTLLGDFRELGMDPEGSYPTVVSGADGSDVLVVQAWRYGQVLGRLSMDFDVEGKLTGYSGSPVILTGEPFLSGSRDTLSGTGLEDVLAAISQEPLVELEEEDMLVAATVESYAEAIDDLEEEPVANALEPLPHVRVPDASLPQGSMIAPLVCDAMIWKARELGIGADIALQNAGGVRIDVPRGEITIGTVYRLLPFSNTLAVLDLTGSQVRQMLENALADIFDRGLSDGAFPYVGGMRYRASMAAAAGSRITELQVTGADSAWVDMEPDAEYRLVTNSFVAGGGDGYSMLSGRPYTDTGFTDTEVFLDYLRMKGAVGPDSQRVFLEQQ